MSERKRKRDSQEKQRPRKKISTASLAASDSVKISVLQDVDEWTPMLGKSISTLSWVCGPSLTKLSINAWHRITA